MTEEDVVEKEESGQQLVQVTFKAPKSLKDRVAEIAQQREIAQQAVLNEILTAGLNHIARDTFDKIDMMIEGKEERVLPKELLLKNATQTILDYLSGRGLSHIIEHIETVCQDGYNGLETWRWLLGAIRYIVEAGMATSIILDDEDVRPVIPKISRCEQCGDSFSPGYWGQRFCSNKCGAEFNEHGARYNRSQEIARGLQVIVALEDKNTTTMRG